MKLWWILYIQTYGKLLNQWLKETQKCILEKEKSKNQCSNIYLKKLGKEWQIKPKESKKKKKKGRKKKENINKIENKYMRESVRPKIGYLKTNKINKSIVRLIKEKWEKVEMKVSGMK